MENNNAMVLPADLIGSKAQTTEQDAVHLYEGMLNDAAEHKEQNPIDFQEDDIYRNLVEKFDSETARLMAEQKSKANKPKINDVKAAVQAWIEHGKPQKAWSLLKKTFGHKKFLPRHADIIYKNKLMIEEQEVFDDKYPSVVIDNVVRADNKTETYRARDHSRLRNSMLIFVQNLHKCYVNSGNSALASHAKYIVYKMTGGRDSYSMFKAKNIDAIAQSNEAAADMKPSAVRKQRTYLNNIIQQDKWVVARNRKHEFRHIYAEPPVLHQDRYVLLGGSGR